MFLDNLLDALKQNKAGSELDRETHRAMVKMKRQQRMTSQEFLKVYDTIWKEGPTTKYKSSDV